MCDIIELDSCNEGIEIKTVEVATKEEQPKRPRGRPHKIKEEIEKVPKQIGRPRKYEIGHKVVYERNPEYFKEYYKNRICREITCLNCNAQLMSIAALKRHEQRNKSCNIKALETENQVTKQYLQILLYQSYIPDL